MMEWKSFLKILLRKLKDIKIDLKASGRKLRSFPVSSLAWWLITTMNHKTNKSSHLSLRNKNLHPCNVSLFKKERTKRKWSFNKSPKIKYFMMNLSKPKTFSVPNIIMLSLLKILKILSMSMSLTFEFCDIYRLFLLPSQLFPFFSVNKHVF